MKQESYKKIFFITFNVILLFFIATRVFLFKKGFLENFATNITYPFLVISKNIVAPFRYVSNQWKIYKKNEKNTLLSLGTMTKFGEIVAVTYYGERYYLCLKDGLVSLIDAYTLEGMQKDEI